jgi:hypothetical protein
MNCAFAIGRLCDHEAGRQSVLKMSNLDKLAEQLCCMIESNMDNGCTKNACFALGCLASDLTAHRMIVEHSCFGNLIQFLLNILLTNRDVETQWFSAMYCFKTTKKNIKIKWFIIK